MFLCLSVLVHKYVVGVCARISMIHLVRPLGVTNSECPQLPNLFLWKDSVSDITTVDPFLFFSVIAICLCTTEIGVMNESVQSLLVQKWKWVIMSAPALHKRVTFDTLFLLEFAHASTPNPSLVPFPPLANFPPRPSPSSNPLLPSSVCFCSLNSLSVLMSSPSLSNYPPLLSLLCLVDCKKETSWG